MDEIGLTKSEIENSRLQFGSNVFGSEKKYVEILIALKQFSSPLVLVLIVSMILTFLIGDVFDGAIIFVALLVNSVLGFFQEYHSEKIFDTLKDSLVFRAMVKRDGGWLEIDSREVVVGDLARLVIGQKVPADGLVIESDGLFVNEAILSGESIAVSKIPGSGKPSKVFGGTIVEKGIGVMKVAAVGMNSEVGKIARDVSFVGDQQSPLQEKVRVLSRVLVIGILFLVLMLVVTDLAKGIDIKVILPLAVALAVAAVPEGLVVSLTLVLSLGMRRILARGSLVKGLMAVETLGSVDVICLDKTGTITEGKMKAVEGVCSLDDKKDDRKLNWLIWGAILCNDKRDPLETAMEIWAREALRTKADKTSFDNFKRVGEIAFDPKYKYIITRHLDLSSKDKFEFFSGAPEVILAGCDLSKKEKDAWLAKFKDFGESGFRLVGFGFRKIGKGDLEVDRNGVGSYEFLGVITFDDPVRRGVTESLAGAKKAGIDLKIITGDYKETAWVAMARAGLVGNKPEQSLIMTGDELEQLAEKDKLARIEKTVLFARTNPSQKMEIVRILKLAGRTVAMTGDGVNDAPALKKADIGIVVGEASDVAKEAGDLILLDNDFKTVLAAIEEGRKIFDNFRKIVVFLLADSFSTIALVWLVSLFSSAVPVLPSQILWTNLISDGFVYLALVSDGSAVEVMKQKPRKRGTPILSKNLLLLILMVSLAVSGYAYGLFWYFYNNLSNLVLARSAVFSYIALAPLVYVFSIRVIGDVAGLKKAFSNRLLNLAVVLATMAVLMVIYVPVLSKIFEVVPLTVLGWGLVVLGLLWQLLVVETIKKLWVKGWNMV